MKEKYKESYYECARIFGVISTSCGLAKIIPEYLHIDTVWLYGSFNNDLLAVTTSSAAFSAGFWLIIGDVLEKQRLKTINKLILGIDTLEEE